MSSNQKIKRSRHLYRQAGPLFIFLLSLSLTACGPAEQGNDQQRPPAPVTTMAVTPENVLIESEYPARVHGSREVQVRARVGGLLEKRLYREGQMVAKDDPLFQIDPEPYQIAWRQSQAERANAAASLEQANREWRRVEGLYRDDAISARERDQALANRELAEARLALAEALVADARRNLRYTEVTAPIGGITDREAFSEGNLLEQGTLLTNITQLDPVHVRFALPEKDAAAQRLGRKILNHSADGEQSAEESIEVVVLLPDGTRHRQTGRLDFTAGTIDPRTGTVSARAVFANPDYRLIPGQFVRLRMVLESLEDVFLIPPEAVGSGRNGPRVFVIDEDNLARSGDVELGPVIENGQVILGGLSAGDRLVVNGQVALADGMPVDPTAADQETAEPAED